MSYEQEAELLQTPLTTTRDRIIEDKIVIDRTKRKALLSYRIGRFDESGKFVDAEEQMAVFRDEEFDQAVQDVFGADAELQQRLKAVRRKAKEDVETKKGLKKGTL